MSKYKGLFTFDVDNHRYLPVEQADGIIDCMNYHPELEMPKEPLIKNEKLEAWKRLKDKGFRFDGVEAFSKGLIEIDAVLTALERADNAERLKTIDDLHLLFGEEEE